MQTISEIKLMYIIISIVMVFFIGFIILIVLIYNRKQLLQFKENQLKEAEFQNELLQKEIEKQKIVEKERMRISHDMHDDLGAGISALKLQAEFLKQKVQDGELKNDINELIKTSEDMNLSMREILWSLNSGNDTLGNFTEYAKNYANTFLKKTSVSLIIEEKNIFAATPVTTEQRHNLFLCLKEALNNAYKHSEASELKLLFIQDKNQFKMTISDNGVGIHHEKTEGNGLRNMRRRMMEQNGCFEIVTDSGVHLSFTLNLPISDKK